VLEGNGSAARFREWAALIRWTLCGASFSGPWVTSNFFTA